MTCAQGVKGAVNARAGQPVNVGPDHPDLGPDLPGQQPVAVPGVCRSHHRHHGRPGHRAQGHRRVAQAADRKDELGGRRPAAGRLSQAGLLPGLDLRILSGPGSDEPAHPAGGSGALHQGPVHQPADRRRGLVLVPGDGHPVGLPDALHRQDRIKAGRPAGAHRPERRCGSSWWP